ncbi:MAG: hypothetical protein MZU97_26445 [Bacillus subtilis]|nr:hypothetical protein [Bacillus subtilis]
MSPTTKSRRLTLADRIVIMKDGRVQQIGTPYEVYQSPANLFVATFMGTPPMNVFQGVELTIEGEACDLAGRDHRHRRASVVSKR